MRFQTAHTPNSLTEGPIAQTLIAFALPLFLGNLFQQLYNTADSLIVGNFLGGEALAAVSSSGNLIFLPQRSTRSESRRKSLMAPQSVPPIKMRLRLMATVLPVMLR